MVVGDFSKHAQTLVIGGGPGGYVAAIRAAQLGQKVTLIEKDTLGGVCLNVGCIPSKAMIHVSKEFQATQEKNEFGLSYGPSTLDMVQTQQWKKTQVVDVLTGGIAALMKKNKISVVYGEAMFIGNEKVRVVGGSEGQTFSFDNAIIATGSRPIEIPGFKFGNRILDSTGALNLKEVPKSMVIVGGGYIGSELAGVYANLGTKVTILEGTSTILPTFSKDLVKEVIRNFEHKGVEILTNVKATKAVSEPDLVTVSFETNGKKELISADYVLVTVGRSVNTDEIGLEYTDVKKDQRGIIEVDTQGRTSVDHIYAIGDVIPGPQLAHKASYEGKVVAEVIAGQAAGFDYTAIPAVSFTDPEIAVVGHTVDSAKKSGFKAKGFTFPLQANGRALSMGKTQGFVRIIVDTETSSILGAELVGEQASELIAELTMAIETQLTLDDISLIVHVHPSLSESIMDASELAKGLPIHI